MDSSMHGRSTSIASAIRKARAKLRLRNRARAAAREVFLTVRPRGAEPPIHQNRSGSTAVDAYWNQHTVHLDRGRFMSAGESEAYLQQRSSEYPMFIELMDLYGV